VNDFIIILQVSQTGKLAPLFNGLFLKWLKTLKRPNVNHLISCLTAFKNKFQ